MFLVIEGIGVFWINRAGSHVDYLLRDPAITPELAAETAIGTPLLLALALQSTWSLHCSAVVSGRGAALFLGDSGSGKSTLARYLSHAATPRFQLLADDILPIELSTQTQGATATTFPHYPQLKYPLLEQPGRTLPERVPATAIFILEPMPAAVTSVEIDPLNPREAALSLIRHSVATQLFDRDLLDRHFRFATALADSLPVFRLLYPHQFDLLPYAGAAITNELAT